MGNVRLRTCAVLTLSAFSMAGCGQDAAPPETAATPAVTTAAPDSPVAAPSPATAVAAPDQLQQLLDGAAEFLKEGHGQLALEALNQAVAAAPQSTEPYLRRAELLSAADLKTQAIADLSQALVLDPRNARAFNTRGYLRMSQNDLAGAVEDFGAAISIDLQFPQPYNNRGLVRISQGDPEKALLDFDAALRIDPHYIDAHNNRGYTLTLLERPDDAVAALSQAIARDATYVNAWNNRGLAHKAAGRMEEAVADFTKAIELQPTNTKYYLHRSEALGVLDRHDEAREDIRRVVWLERLTQLNRRVTAEPQQAAGWMERADHMRLGRRYEAALNDVQRAIQLYGAAAPEASDAFVLQARILLDQGLVERAIEAANTAAQIRPGHEVYSVRGDAYLQLQNYEAAVADYQQSRRLDETVRQAFELRAAQLETSGQVEQAGYFREKASALSPDKLRQSASVEAVEPAPFPVDSARPAAADGSPAVQ